MPRGNPQNLNKVRSTEEAKKRGRAGGIKSGQVRRERKTLREDLLALLSAGKTQEDMNLALIARALTGDVKAYEVIRDTIGEKPIDKVMVAEVDQNVINEVEAMINNDEE